MSPSVLLFLSILTVVQGSGCDYLNGVKHLHSTIQDQYNGFRQVFPRNYHVSHHYNASLLCKDPCCVFSAAVVLSDSWNQLVQHLWRQNLKFNFIQELKTTLDDIAKFQETPDPSIFPFVSSSPSELLSFTSDLFERWLKLDCPPRKDDCVFPTVAPDMEEESKEEEGRSTGGGPLGEQQFEREGDRGKRWSLTAIPTNGDAVSDNVPGFPLWRLSLLWTALDITMRML